MRSPIERQELAINKLLKILFVIEFFLISIIIVLSLIDNQTIPTAYVIKEINNTEKNENIDFKILTKAVCEESSEHLFCRDKLFVKCNGKDYVVEDNPSNFTECNNLKLNLSDYKVNGSGIFKRR